MSAAIPEDILKGSSEMATLMRSHDWSTTPVGSLENWPPSLKTAIRLILGSRYPMFVWWGGEMTNFYNDAYISVLGKRHPQALGQPASQVWAEIWDTLGPQAEAVLQEGQATWNEELLLLMERNGYLEETYFTFSYSPVGHDDGSVGGVFCACTEDTQRVLGDRRLQTLRKLGAETATAKTVEEACQITTTVFAHNNYDIPFALLYLLDHDNQQARLVSTAGLAVGALASPETINLNEATANAWSLNQVIATGNSQVIEDLKARFGLLPGGAWSQSSNNAVVVPLKQTGQEMLGFLIAGVSPLRVFDEDYRGFFNLIAGQVTAAIANVRVYEEERKRAEALAELDRAKTIFFSNVSHEFRTPLTLMLGPVEDALGDREVPLPTRQQERIEIVQRNGLRLLKLVNTLLDFSRIEAGRIQATYESTDLAALTIEIASVFRSAIERANLHFMVDCPPLSAPICVDREMWEKIVLNLLSNAFKFTLEGEIAVILRESNSQIELEVRDTGIGIATDEIPRIFERFHRVREAKGRTYEGSGIGLSLVQELVRLQGGTISVSSIVDRGTSFTVSIPAGCARLPPDRLAVKRTLTSTATGSAPYVEEALRWLPAFGGSSKFSVVSSELQENSLTQNSKLKTQNFHRILLVDDNTDMREYVTRLLSERGYEVKAVVDGMAALVAVGQQMPDLVLSDVMMPRLDGFAFLRELRSDPTTREIPIILLSARAGEESRVEGLEAGADDYLIKPFSARELLARVEANLKLAQLRQKAGQREQVLRREAETARQKVDTILSSISDGFFVLDRDWRYTYVNDRLCEMLATQRDEIIDKTIWNLFPALVGSELYVQFHRAMAEQTPIQFEYFYSSWNRWYENRVYPAENGLTVFCAEITERKQHLSALQESQALYQTLAEAMPHLVWMMTPDGQIHYVNQQFQEVLGVTAQQINQAGWELTVHPDDLARSITAWTEAMSSGSEVTIEVRLRTADGSYRWFLGRAVPLRDEDGEIRLWIGTDTDINGRKQTEEALRQSEERYRILTEVSPQIVWMGTSEGEITYCNQYWFDYTGLNWEKTAAHGWISSIHPEDRERVFKTWKESVTQETHYEVEIRLRRGVDNAYRWYVARGLPLQVASGQVVKWIGIASDIHAAKHREAERKQTEERLHLLYEMTSDLLATEHPLLLMNKVFSKLSVPLGLDFYDNFMIEEKDHRPMLHLRNYGGITKQAAQAIEWVEFGQYLCGLVAKECRPLIFDRLQISTHPNAQSLYSAGVSAYAGYPLVTQGRLLGTLSFASLTRTSFTSEEIDLMQSTCEQVAIALERANLTASIQQQAEQLQQANRIKDEFLAVLSHELRSPLNPILGWSKLLQTNQLDSTQTQQALNIIERNAKLQTELIEDLLDVSRILQGKLNLNVCPVNLGSMIQAAMETVRLAAQAKSIEIETTLDKQIGQVLGDPNRLQQVIWNLLSNAVKFTPQGGRVEVCLESFEFSVLSSQLNPELSTQNSESSIHNSKLNTQNSQSFAQITVSDTGKGIAPEFLPHVFDYFRQADSTTTRKFGGLGLGLAIVRHLVELHGGTIKVDSAGEGQGATFTLKLPMVNAPTPLNSHSQLSEPSPDLQDVRVLIVDDDTDTREFVTFVLERSGAKVMTATCALEALTKLTQAKLDVLLSDIGMPETDGYTLIRQIRALPNQESGQIPAIALTAYAGDFNQQQALQAGFQQHLTKPIDPDELVKAIAILMGKSSKEKTLNQTTF